MMAAQPRHISVFETTLCIQRQVVSVFHVVIQTPTTAVSLVRYPFDFVEFHEKIKHHYPRSKVPFPTLLAPTVQLTRRRSIRTLLPFSRKSNAEKIEHYLTRCFDHPVISISSILRDFLTAQRDEDKHTAPSSSTLSSDACNSIKSALHTPPSLVRHDPLVPQTKISLDDFELLHVLGKGCMGKVLLVRSTRDRRLYALKAIRKRWVIQQKEVNHTRAERDILTQLRDQPFLIKLHYAFQTPSQLYLVLDYYSGGDIATQMSLCTTFSQKRTQFYAAEILHGLSILHRHGIIYRDLKPENILIGPDGHIVLTDFGLSKAFPPEEGPDSAYTQTFCGTAEYLAPEVLLGEPYSFTIDYWSLGTLLFEMLAGITPFWAETHMEMYRRVLEDPLEFPPHIGAVTRSFLSGLLERDTRERLGGGGGGADAIKAHPYFANLDWDVVSQQGLVPPFVPVLQSETDLSNFDDAFIAMPARLSQDSKEAEEEENEEEEEDRFRRFSFDPVDSHEVIKSAKEKPLIRRQTPCRLARERFSSSSSLLSFQGEIVRHTDTLPAILHGKSCLSSTRAAHLRKRHSAALALDGLACRDDDDDDDEEEEERALRHTSKKRPLQPHSLQDAFHHGVTDTGTLKKAPSRHLSLEDASSIYSKSSMTFSSSALAAETRAGSEASDDPPRYHERPSCPVPGQARPPIPLPNTACNSTCSSYENMQPHNFDYTTSDPPPAPSFCS